MYKLENVTALWPKIDRTYRYDSKEQRSVPCSATDDGAEYSINIEMTPEQGNDLHKYCEAAWAEFLKDNPKATKQNAPYKKNEQGLVVAKAKLKGAYNGEATRKPAIYDAKNQSIRDEGFQLTTGSTINVAVTAVPYSAMGGGISLRLNAVQVIELADMGAASSPFGEAEGFSQPTTPFSESVPAEATPVQAVKKVANGGIEDDIPFMRIKGVC